MIQMHFLVAAQAAYHDKGYHPMDVPWWATRDIVNLTKNPNLPKDNEYELSLNHKCLIASGEQGFLYLANKGQLPQGTFQTMTPCFRNEPHDTYHQKQFMKLELIDYLPAYVPRDGSNHAEELNHRIATMLHHAFEVFQTVAQNTMSLRMVETHASDPTHVPGTQTYDIEGLTTNEWIELGSYGARHAAFGTWIYGTGLAEPRFSKVLHSTSPIEKY